MNLHMLCCTIRPFGCKEHNFWYFSVFKAQVSYFLLLVPICILYSLSEIQLVFSLDFLKTIPNYKKIYFSRCSNISSSNLIKYFQDFVHLLQIRIWSISPSQVECIRTLGGHSNVIMRLILTNDRAASRDLDGNILIWDLTKAIEDNYAFDEYEKILVRRVKSVSRTVTCIAMDDRKLVMGSIGQFCIFDYWNTALWWNTQTYDLYIQFLPLHTIYMYLHSTILWVHLLTKNKIFLHINWRELL